jgi:type I restriction enzyme R subunit
MHPDVAETKPNEAIPSRIFALQLQQLPYLKEANDPRLQLLHEKIMSEVKSLPTHSIAIRERRQDIEKVLSPIFWENVGINQPQFLKTNIAPLMRYQQDIGLNEASWILKAERLALAALKKDQHDIDRLKPEMGAWLDALPLSIAEVRDKEEILQMVLRPDFWRTVSFEDAQMLLKEFGPLMKYRDPEPRRMIIVDIGDVIQKRELIEYGPIPTQEFVKTYVEKVEKKIRQLAENHPTIIKIKRDEILTELDLKFLEKTLNSAELYITEETLQRAYKQHKGTLVQFRKEDIGTLRIS